MEIEPWGKDNCSAIKAHFAVFSVPQAAALWCGVPEDALERIVGECEQVSKSGFERSVWRHPYISCIEPRSRAIAEAMEKWDLIHGLEDGEPANPLAYVPYERRHCQGRDLKKWMERAFPGEKPEFLFSAHERASGSGISLEDYQTIQAKNAALELRLERAKSEYRKLLQKNAELDSECKRYAANDNRAERSHPRSEASYQRIIGALLSVIHGDLPDIDQHPSIKNESQLIALLADKYSGYEGLSIRSLSEKFPQARRRLERL